MSNLPILKPCPFCGSEAKFEQTQENEMPSLWWYVACTNGDCVIAEESMFISERRGIAAKLWNTRP